MTQSYLERFRAKALPILTATSHASAPFIATFLLIHLSAPTMANIGGSSLSSRTMLLGREYYQTVLSEPLLVLGPIGLHGFSGALKRLLSPRGRPPRRFTHLLSLTGYATFLLFLPIHFATHRAYTLLDVDPIYSVGPSELDYEFVKSGLRGWPVRSALLYGGLVISTTLHFVDGLTIIWNTRLKDTMKNVTLPSLKLETRTRRMVIALGCIALPTLAGLYALSREPIEAFASLVRRYEAVFQTCFVYRL